MDQVPNSAQHVIECDTESCRNFSEFYCNTCHQGICDQCKQPHLEQNIGHEIVLYKERKRKVPSEKCSIHPTQDIDVYCDDCHNYICSTCFALNHSDHVVSDLETIYNNTLHLCQTELMNIWGKVIPKAKENIKSLGDRREFVKKKISELRLSMKKCADELREAVDTILANASEKLDEIKNSILNDLMEQEKNTQECIYYLETTVTDYERKMPSIKPSELLKFHTDISLAQLKTPNLAKQKLPIFITGTLNTDEIATQFGEIKINSSEELCSCITKVNEVAIDASGVSHLSALSDKFWASDNSGYLIQSDLEGHLAQKIPIHMRGVCSNHIVTTEGELFYTDNEKRAIYRVTSDMSTTKLICTRDEEPGAICASRINGHILVGMWGDDYMKIYRYSPKGRKLQDISINDKRKHIYYSVCYITENINFDICTSDSWAKSVVVVTGLGEYRYSYSGHQSQSGFIPYGICTDNQGLILVCNGYKDRLNNCCSVHLLDMDGQFLTLLLTPDQCPYKLRALCFDDQDTLMVGNEDSPTVTLYRYHQMKGN
ncbi:uncharacterized protein LOC133180632 [Saccostrea echinata]|uniref:uncharacterized protein LOC133180632 n=1 Tax=Saccostrea echinata TaxID=191078 RepID=UPI002A7F95F9|nr:uncharacterized protein LOC133180632 [Saccostrea echinata]